MNWFNEIRPILEIAFREGGNGIIWTGIGALVGLILSIILIAFLFSYAFKKRWPTEATWGAWCRWILLIYCILTLPTTLITTGAGLGVIKAIQDAVNNEQVIEKATAKGASGIIAMLYVALETKSSGESLSESETNSLISGYLSKGKTINLAELENSIEGIEFLLNEGIVELADRKFNKGSEDQAASFSTYISNKIWTWLVEGEVERIMIYVDEVIDDVKKRDIAQSNETTVQEIAFSIGGVHVKPFFNREASKMKKATLYLSFAQVALLLVIPFGVIHFVSKRVVAKPPKQESLEEPA
jgi:hypothetical protein